MKKLLQLFLIVLISIVLFKPSVVFGAESGSISIYPTNFDPNDPSTRALFQINLKPEEEYSGQVTVFNKSDQTKTVNIYAVDATTTSDGVFSLYQKGMVDDLGGWINLSNSSLSLQPKEKKEISFNIKVPLNASVGDHSAGIVVEEGSNSQTNNGVNIVSRVGVRVYVNISGKSVEELSIGSPMIENYLTTNKITLPVENTGNTNQIIKSEFFVIGLNGIQTIKSEKENFSLPGKKIDIQERATVIAPLFLSTKLTYGKDKNLLKEYQTTTPNLIIIVLTIILIVGCLIFIKIKGFPFKKNKHIHNPGTN